MSTPIGSATLQRNQYLHHLPNQPEELVGHIAERRIQPRRRSQDGAPMGEGLETLTAVIAAHAGIADTAERQGRIGNVHDRVVEATAA